MVNCELRKYKWNEDVIQFTIFPHSMFHSFHGLMNSLNWPAPCVWVFIAQLVEHGSAIAEATGSNPVEAPEKNFFFEGGGGGGGYFAAA